jgi:hypothetical protein
MDRNMGAASGAMSRTSPIMVSFVILAMINLLTIKLVMIGVLYPKFTLFSTAND